MARVKKVKTEQEIIAKYSKLVDKKISDYWDKPMAELWKALDKLKARMKKELMENGFESQGDNLD